jgi:predicted alpha/beta hydrolase
MTQLDLVARDGVVLRGTLYGEGNEHALVIAGAMGVPRRYYDAFAQHAAARRFAVLTFDYRGMGESSANDPRLQEWGTHDIAAAIEFFGSRRVTLVAHSVGGQVAGLAHNLGRAESLVFVASQSGWWRHWDGVRRLGVGFLWLTMPTLSRILGYFPTRLFLLGPQNLPRGVALQWAEWGRNPRYVWGSGLDLSGYAAYRGPVLAWSFADDGIAPPRAVDAQLREYPNARIDHRRPGRGFGHFGFFRRGVGERLWDETLEWVSAQARSG